MVVVGEMGIGRIGRVCGCRTSRLLMDAPHKYNVFARTFFAQLVPPILACTTDPKTSIVTVKCTMGKRELNVVCGRI